jgi:hypothetical protein
MYTRIGAYYYVRMRVHIYWYLDAPVNRVMGLRKNQRVELTLNDKKHIELSVASSMYDK